MSSRMGFTQVVPHVKEQSIFEDSDMLRYYEKRSRQSLNLFAECTTASRLERSKKLAHCARLSRPF